MRIWYFPITEEGNEHVYFFLHINAFSIQMDRPIPLIYMLIRAKHGCFSSVNPNAVFAPVSDLRTGDISPEPLGPQDRLAEPSVVTDACIEEKYNVSFHCLLENSCFQSTNHLPKQCKEIMVYSLC